MNLGKTQKTKCIGATQTKIRRCSFDISIQLRRKENDDVFVNLKATIRTTRKGLYFEKDESFKFFDNLSGVEEYIFGVLANIYPIT